MVIIFDLDGVLFGVDKFKDGLRKIFNDFGIDDELFNKTYQLSKQDKGYYQWRLQIDILKEQNPKIDSAGLREKTLDFFNHCKEFLLPEVKELLTRLQKENELFLLTFGDRELQLIKVKSCDLEKYFQEIIIARSFLKDEEIGDLIQKYPDKEIIFIEDNPETVGRIRELFRGKLKVIEKGVGESIEELMPDIIYPDRNNESLQNSISNGVYEYENFKGKSR